jgi:hypothetical protein
MAYGSISSMELLHTKQLIIAVLALLLFAVGVYVLAFHSPAQQKASLVQTGSSQNTPAPINTQDATQAPLESTLL